MAYAAPAVDVIVMTGDPAPDGNGTFSALDFFPVLNDQGEVAFAANLTNTNGSFSDDSGIFRGDGDTIVQIVRESQLVPGGNGYFSQLARDFYGPLLNELGQVSFAAGLYNTAGAGADDGGAFLGDGTALVQLVRKGQLWPDGAGQLLGVPRSSLNPPGAERPIYV